MKILYVEGNPNDRGQIKASLESRGCQVECYLPKESLYCIFDEAGEIQKFQNPEELSDLIGNTKPGAVILDRETFTKKFGSWGDIFDSYLGAVLSGYTGEIIVTTTAPWKCLELSHRSPHQNKKIRLAQKLIDPYLTTVLKDAN